MQKTSCAATLAALAFAGAASAESVQNGAVGEGLEAAGFAGARVLPGVELAWVEGQDGRRFLVIGGLERMSAIGTPLAPEHMVAPAPAQAPDEPAVKLADAPTAAGIEDAADLGRRLDDVFAEAGFSTYRMLDDAAVAELIVGSNGGAWPLQILVGLDQEGE